MRTKHIFLFIINMIIMLLLPLAVHAQIGDTEKPVDTLVYRQKYGLRLGGDLGKIGRSLVDKDYTGF